ncbi:autotransporter domain-containing protein [Sphingosinicella humi]|uniref:Autotransporter domain-containing esterase n=1 Tax=Allosphingosinicella humi TaxID=2068657 RepID=A0A2U2J2M4_9SPHN|nr:autotransporter domain-containing protein [Sphingosinicella humi]PWG02595.1 autotransporter domain-containing esterase [Sphingosinicella humi]
MSRFSTKLLCAVASSTLVWTAPATAQSVDRIVAFGDSYADDGNLFELIGIDPPFVYPTGRFSGGTNFVDTMSTLLNAPVDNFAIGGALTGTTNFGIANVNDNPAAPQGIPGFPTQIGAFLAGGGPAAFPRVDGTFATNDLVVVSIGGNDARFYQFNGGTVAGAPARAQVSVAEASAGLNALVDAGARNITFLAGDVGRLPEVDGLPVAEVGSAFATAFNTGIQAELADLAAEGVIVNYLDLNTIGDVVENNLAAFGLTSAGACPAPDCIADASLQSRYLFYVDRLHLTSAGFAIFGRYAVRQLEAPLHFQAQTDVGLHAAQTFGSTLLGRLDTSGVRSGGGEDGLNLYVTGSFAGRDVAASRTNLAYDLDGAGVTLGAEYGMGPGAVVGAAVNYSMPKADFDRGLGSAKADAIQLGLYGGWAGAAAFVEGYAGYGWLDFENARAALIDEIEGETDGTALTAGAKAGYLLGLGGWRVGPVIGLQYARTELDGYTETGDPVLTLTVGDQEAEALVGSAGIEARGAWDVGGLAVRPYASLTAERDFEGDGRIVRYAGTASPTIVNSFVLPDRGDDTYGRITGGADIELVGSLSLQLTTATSFARKGGEELFGMLGLKAGF